MPWVLSLICQFVFLLFLNYLSIVSRLGVINWLIVIIVTNISKLAGEVFDCKDENILTEHNLLVIIHFISSYLPTSTYIFYPFFLMLKEENWNIIYQSFLIGLKILIPYPLVNADDKLSETLGKLSQVAALARGRDIAPREWIDSERMPCIRWSPVLAGFSKEIIDLLPPCLRPTTCKLYERNHRKFFFGQKAKDLRFPLRRLKVKLLIFDKMNRGFSCSIQAKLLVAENFLTH